MPERRRVRGCGKECIRCWQNNLKHGSRRRLTQKEKDERKAQKEEHKRIYNLERVRRATVNDHTITEHDNDSPWYVESPFQTHPSPRTRRLFSVYV